MRRLGRSGLRWKLVLALVADERPPRSRPPAAWRSFGPLRHGSPPTRLDAMRRLAGDGRASTSERLPARDLRARVAAAGADRHRPCGAARARTSSCSTPRARPLAGHRPPARANAGARSESADRVAAAGTNRASELRPGRPRPRGDRRHAPSPTHAGPVTLVLRKPLDDSRAAVGVMRGALPVAALAGLTIALLLGTALSFGLLRRLERLRQGARTARRGPGSPRRSRGDTSTRRGR